MAKKPDRGTAAHRYGTLENTREPYLRAAFESAAVTIPHEFPRGHSANQSSRLREELDVPNQDLGARGVNNLAEKIHLTLLPPNINIVKYEPDPQAKAQTDPAKLAEIEQLLAVRERTLTASIDAARYRPKLSPIARQLIVAGNVLINHVNQKIRTFRLDRFVTLRDPFGLVQEIVLKENLDYATLDDRVRAVVDADTSADKDDDGSDRDIEVFTWVKREGNVYKHFQEVMGKEVPGTQGTSPVASPQWIAATMYRADGEDYGRGHVEQYIGSLEAYDSLTLSVVEDAQIAAMAIPMVDPNGMTEIEDVRRAKNGEAIEGREQDVGFLKVGKNADLAVADRMMQRLESSLSFAFLLNSAVRRDAERVTAEEIRQIGQELDASLGGFYSTLTEEIQLPIVLGHERDLERSGKLPRLDPKLVTPVIMTGLESIGRGQDAMNMQLFAQDLQVWAPALQTQFGSAIKEKELLDQLATSRSVDASSFVMTDEEHAQAQQQAQQQAMMQQASSDMGAAAVKATSDQQLAAMKQEGGEQ